MAWDNHNRPGRHGFPKAIARRILRNATGCALQYPGCTDTPQVADHVTPWAEAVLLGWDPRDIDHPDNGQALCPNCSNLKTQAEAQRGRARAAARRPAAKRAARPHPGLKPPP